MDVIPEVRLAPLCRDKFSHDFTVDTSQSGGGRRRKRVGVVRFVRHGIQSLKPLVRGFPSEGGWNNVCVLCIMKMDETA